MIDDILVALGVSKSAVTGGSLGALLSLKFLGTSKFWAAVINFCAGLSIAVMLQPLASHYLALSPKLDGGVGFLIGWLGMMCGKSFINALPEWIAAAKQKFLGGGQ